MGKTPVKVDVLMPFHRIDDYFIEAIQSVLDSTGVIINLILLDNRRGDRPELALDSFFNRLKDTCHTIQKISVSYPFTYSNALNTGLNHCRNAYIALMNSDDLIQPNRFYLQSKSLIQSEYELSICSLQKFSEKRETSSMLGILNLKYYSWLYLLLGAYGADASLMFKRSWSESGNRTFPETQHSDWLFALQNYPNAQIVTIEQPLYHYRIHPNQITKSPELHKIETLLSDALVMRLETLGIQVDEYEVLEALAAPFLRVKLRSKQIKKLQHICDSFLTNFESKKQKRNVRQVLARRLLFAFKNPIQIFKVGIRWQLPVAVELFKILGSIINEKIAPRLPN